MEKNANKFTLFQFVRNAFEKDWKVNMKKIYTKYVHWIFMQNCDFFHAKS